MSYRLDIHIQTSSLTFHCDIFHFDIISSLFFSGITYHHLWYSFFVFSLITTYSTLSLFHLEWWFFTRYYMGDCHIFPPVHPMGSGSEISVWEVVLLVRIRSSYVERVWSFGYVFSFEVIHYWSEYAQKKKKKWLHILHYIILHWTYVWTHQFASLCLCVRESSYENFFF